jgi:alkylation response protein AidB-like acyl-CoA dehydrogenase
MEFRLDEAQVELRDTVARFCADRFPLGEVVHREGAGLDRTLWSAMAALGIFEVQGLGLLEAALVFEQLGAGLAPGPVLWTALAAPLVDGAGTGALVVGGVEASAVAGGAALVEHAADLDLVLVLGAGSVTAHRVADLRVGPALDALDPLTPVREVAGLTGGEVVGDAAPTRRAGTVLAAAMLTGIAGRALEVARDHALQRHQFGVPIGSFQAIKHLLADMHVRHGLAQSATYAAAAVDDAGDARSAAAGAKLLAGEAAVTNAGAAIQVLGGMGFTWEMPPNHLLKRAWVLEQSFGDADGHALDLGRAMVHG